MLGSAQESPSRELKIISDPVHGYVVLAAHEGLMIDHPITQRLRRVTQTGLAELVCPEARSSRFIHSLGTMHLASRFFNSAIENSETSVLIEFFNAAHAEFFQHHKYLRGESELRTASGTLNALGVGRLLLDQRDLSPTCRSQYYEKAAFLEAGLRLAALFHDLGHLPFSHDFELALKEYYKEHLRTGIKEDPLLSKVIKKKAPHEEIGHKLAHLLFSSLRERAPDPLTTVFSIAKKILDEEPIYGNFTPPPSSAFQWLHSLIDGDVDADRADYLLRDGRALGLEFAQYDVDRLVSNLELYHDSELGFITVVKERGLTALESFFLSRSRSNQVLVRHHKVAQVSAALRYATAHTLHAAEGQHFLESIRELLRLANQTQANPTEAENILGEFAGYDDSWWLQALRHARPRPRQMTNIKSYSNRDENLMAACFSLLLDRKDSLRSIWKRKGRIDKSEIDLMNAAALFVDDHDNVVFDKKRELLLSKGVLLVTHKFTPYRIFADESMVRIKCKKGYPPCPMSRLSPIIKSLVGFWVEDVHMHASTINDEITFKEVFAILTNDA